MIDGPNLKRAVKAAYRMRERYSTGLVFDPFLPISVQKRLVVCKYTTFCRMHGIGLNEFLATVSTDGFTLRRGGNTIIIYNDLPNVGDARRRFTLAHELGHYALKHTTGSEDEEREADCFARNLLAPRLIALERGIAFSEYSAAFGISAAAARMCYRWREQDEELAKGLYPFKHEVKYAAFRIG